MAQVQHEIQEAPELAALGSPEVASGDLPIGLKAMVDAGLHFGHQTQRWNPKMRQYIYGSRNGVHIIDLDKTTGLFKRAYEAVANTVSRGGSVLFVGTKRQASEIIFEEATRAGQFYVTGRWLGGTLTNFRTVKASIDRLRQLEAEAEDGTLDSFTKKEALSRTREQQKLDNYLGGIKMMDGIPSLMVVVDPNHEHIAINEARKLHIPVVALTDTNCDPSLVDYVIPGNDDALRAIKLIVSRLADACLEGQQAHRSSLQQVSSTSMEGVEVQYARGAAPLEEKGPEAVAETEAAPVAEAAAPEAEAVGEAPAEAAAAPAADAATE